MTRLLENKVNVWSMEIVNAYIDNVDTLWNAWNDYSTERYSFKRASLNIKIKYQAFVIYHTSPRPECSPNPNSSKNPLLYYTTLKLYDTKIQQS